MSDQVLLEELKAAHKELLFINEFTRQAMKIEKVHALWPLVADHLASFFNCDRVTCYLLESGQLFSIHAQGLFQPIAVSVNNGIDSKEKIGIACHVAQSGQVYLTNEPYQDPYFVPIYDEQTGYRTLNVLACTIYHQKRLLGVVELLNKNNGFTHRDSQSLERFVPQIGFVFDKLQSDYEKERLETNMAQTHKLEAVGELAASVAHELIGPIMSMITNSQLITMRLPLESEIQTQARSVEEEAHRCQRIISKLMQLIPPRALDLHAIPLHPIIENILNTLEGEARARNIAITQNIQPEAPPVKADEFLLHQVCKQIIINAVRSMPNGGTLAIQLELHGERVALKITDTGEGVPPKDLPHIFEPFYKSHLTGTYEGLELAACLGIVQCFGGALGVDSPGEKKGTTFTITLPIGDAKDKEKS